MRQSLLLQASLLEGLAVECEARFIKLQGVSLGRQAPTRQACVAGVAEACSMPECSCCFCLLLRLPLLCTLFLLLLMNSSHDKAGMLLLLGHMLSLLLLCVLLLLMLLACCYCCCATCCFCVCCYFCCH